MAVDFRVASHNVKPDTRIVEVLVDGKVAAVIYPMGAKGIKLVSAHIEETEAEKEFAGTVVKDDGGKNWPPIPALLVTFDPSPYTIVGNKVVKHS